MGTKIDEYKKHLLDIMDSMPDDACGDWRDSLAYAIETMRKYQKIEQIYQKWNKVNDFTYNQAMQEIGEVIEDEKGG